MQQVGRSGVAAILLHAVIDYTQLLAGHSFQALTSNLRRSSRAMWCTHTILLSDGPLSLPLPLLLRLLCRCTLRSTAGAATTLGMATMCT
jgi:hypothetical protein